jgi:4-amino-4-deoxy-L-arabinose transferase-like glycosyltransferase
MPPDASASVELAPARSVPLSDHGALPQARFWTRRARIVTTALVATACSLVVFWPYAGFDFLNVDEAAHFLGARTLLEGGRLYVDFADNKPPLVYFFYAVAQLLLGPGIDAVRWTSALLLVPGTAMAAGAFYGFDRRGLAAAVAFVLASASLLAADAHVVHCEHVMLLPLAWSMVLLRSPRLRARFSRVLAAGLLVGIASLGKQTALAFVVGYALILMLDRARPLSERLRSVLLLCGGVALPWLVLGAWLWQQHGLEDAIFWIWRYNAQHVDNPMPLADAVGRAVLFGSGLLPAMLPLVLAFTLARTRPASPAFPRHFWIILLVCAALPALLGMRLFGHYFVPVVLILALLAGPSFAAAFETPQVLLVGFALLCFTVVSAVGYYVHDPAQNIADVSRLDYEVIGSELRARDAARAEHGTLFVWGYAPMIYAHARLHAASRFVVPIDTLSGYVAGNDAAIEGRVNTDDRISSAHWDLLMSELEDHPPDYFVDTAPGDLNHWGRYPLERFPRLSTFVARHYRFDSHVSGAALYLRSE